MTDLKRLGKRGSYRLGRLRAQGVGMAGPQEQFRPVFARPRHRGPAALWLLGCLLGTVVIVAGVAGGLWFVPFIVGVAAGLANWAGRWRLRAALPAVAAMAIIGWGVPLWWPALHGQPSGATARVIAALAGLPAYAVTGIAAALLVAVAQILVGFWLGRALSPRAPG